MPTALIYRGSLLPYSETFVAAQARTLNRYSPVLVGERRVDGLDFSDLRSHIIGTKPVRLQTVRRTRFFEPSLATLRDLDPSLVHAHFGPDGLSAEPLAQALEIPLVVTFHGHDAAQSTSLSEGLPRWRYGRRIPGLTRRAARVVAVSEHVRRLLIERGCPPEQVVTHHIGIDPTLFHPEARSAEPGLILGVGRVVEKKGFNDLVEAFRRLTPQAANARLVILGSGPGHAALRRHVAGDPRISLPGAVSADEVRQWLQRADVLAVPSVTAANGDTEGLPTVVIEAMAAGAPLVATRHAGIPEAVIHGETGLLVPERSPNDLATAILHLLRDRQFAESLSRAGVARVARHFDMRIQSQTLEAIYDEAVTHDRARRRKTASRVD